MSFLGGPECSTAGNPLSQFTKHVQDDKSLQRDRLVGRAPGSMQESMRTGGAVGWQDQAMDEFLQAPAQLPSAKPASPFAMEQMRRELERFQAQPLRSHTGSPGWAAEFHPQTDDQTRMNAAFPAVPDSSSAFNPADFARYQQLARSGSSERTSSMPQIPSTLQRPYQSPMSMGYGGMSMGMGGMGLGMSRPFAPLGSSLHQQPPAANLAESQDKGKGKSRMVELDDENWEAQFAQVDAEGRHDLDAEANAAIGRQLDELERSEHPSQLLPSETNLHGDFESIWRGIEAETALNRDLAADADADAFDLGDINQWADFDSPLNAHSAFTRDPQLGDYLFETDNLFHDTPDPYAEGQAILSSGGNLSLAALAFEAAVQRDPEHTRAWLSLGNAQAQNEKESPAIRALEQCLKLDPTNLPALMSLAVSYTNEGYDSTAYRTLERWLAVKYPSITSSSSHPLSSSDPASTSESASDLAAAPGEMGFTDRAQLHDKITSLFIAAAQLSPSGAAMDPDVQVGLGVLFYGDEAYDKAVDCFSAALASTETGSSNAEEQLHLLWNRLGATLANSGRSEEAIAAYERALQLRPNFVRARYNLGVSCINVGCYDEAAQHLLGALAMHEVVLREGRERAREILGGARGEGGGGGIGEEELESQLRMNQSTNLYDTLRRVFGQMGRRDLAERVVAGMSVEGFRGEFDF